MTHSQACTDLVASFEGCELNAYLDQRGVPTIGYGHTSNVVMGDICNDAQALAWLSEDLMTADKAVAAAITPAVNQNEWDAMVSLAYNIGSGNFLHSTLVRLLNAEDFEGAANQFLAWCHINGVVSPGLTRRRTAERALFLTVPQ